MAGAANIIEGLEAKLEERLEEKNEKLENNLEEKLEKRKGLAAKTIFGFGLFIFFVWMFGQPALEKYQAESVITLEEEIHHGFKYPTVTVCPSSDESKWKKGENIHI